MSTELAQLARRLADHYAEDADLGRATYATVVFRTPEGAPVATYRLPDTSFPSVKAAILTERTVAAGDIRARIDELDTRPKNKKP